MKINRYILILPVVILSAAFQVEGGSMGSGKNPALTIYRNNFALVREHRDVELDEGLNLLRATDIPSGIEPDSVYFKSLTLSEKFNIIEQNYDYGLADTDRILKQNIGREVVIHPKSFADGKSYKGVLKGFDGKSLIIDVNGDMNIQNRMELTRMVFPGMKEEGGAVPVLEWRIKSDDSARHLAELTYITSGISWNATYTCVISEDERTLDLEGWVNVDNRSGTDYNGAVLKVVAGDIRRVEGKRSARKMYTAKKAMQVEADFVEGRGAAFNEGVLAEYQIYELKGLTTIGDRQKKKIELLSGRSIPVKKVFTFNGRQDKDKVRLKLEFVNSAENNMGVIMPGGKVMVYKNLESRGSEHSPVEFIGEDLIGHKPPEEKIQVSTGNALNVVGKWEKTSYEKIGEKAREEGYRITLRNHKKERVVVVIKEQVWGDWEVRKKSHKYLKKDANTLEFEVEVSPFEEVQVDYTVRIKH